MKNTVLVGSIAAALLGASFALAQAPADEHAGHHPEGATPSAVQPTATGTAATAIPRMQDSMRTMQDLMAKIHASKDGAERKQLLQRHSKAMMDHMEMMHGMGGGMPGGPGATSGAQAGQPMNDGMMKQMMMNHQAMQGRLDMMEMMMGQMLQNQEAQQKVKPAK